MKSVPIRCVFALTTGVDELSKFLKKSFPIRTFFRHITHVDGFGAARDFFSGLGLPIHTQEYQRVHPHAFVLGIDTERFSNRSVFV